MEHGRRREKGGHKNNEDIEGHYYRAFLGNRNYLNAIYTFYHLIFITVKEALLPQFYK